MVFVIKVPAESVRHVAVGDLSCRFPLFCRKSVGIDRHLAVVRRKHTRRLFVDALFHVERVHEAPLQLLIQIECIPLASRVDRRADQENVHGLVVPHGIVSPVLRKGVIESREVGSLRARGNVRGAFSLSFGSSGRGGLRCGFRCLRSRRRLRHRFRSRCGHRRGRFGRGRSRRLIRRLLPAAGSRQHHRRDKEQRQYFSSHISLLLKIFRYSAPEGPGPSIIAVIRLFCKQISRPQSHVLPEPFPAAVRTFSSSFLRERLFYAIVFAA